MLIVILVFCCYACRLTYDKSPLTPTHLFVAYLTACFSLVHRIIYHVSYRMRLFFSHTAVENKF